MIANCRNCSLSANHDRKKNYRISCDREMQKWANFCKLQSQEKLYHFSRKTIPFLLIANCRIGPLSANYDHKKHYKISQEKLYKFCKLRSQEKLDHFSRKTIPFLMIANCRKGPLFANYDRQKNYKIANCRNGPLSANYYSKTNYTISPDRELQKWATFCKLRLYEKL